MQAAPSIPRYVSDTGPSEKRRKVGEKGIDERIQRLSLKEENSEWRIPGPANNPYGVPYRWKERGGELTLRFSIDDKVKEGWKKIYRNDGRHPILVKETITKSKDCVESGDEVYLHFRSRPDYYFNYKMKEFLRDQFSFEDELKVDRDDITGTSKETTKSPKLTIVQRIQKHLGYLVSSKKEKKEDSEWTIFDPLAVGQSKALLAYRWKEENGELILHFSLGNKMKEGWKKSYPDTQLNDGHPTLRRVRIETVRISPIGPTDYTKEFQDYYENLTDEPKSYLNCSTCPPDVC